MSENHPEHYRASREVVGSGPLRAFGSVLDAPIGLAHWRAPAVDLVQHINEDHPTILFHAAGGQARSESGNRFRAGGTGWPGEALLVPTGADVRCRWDAPTEWMHVYFQPGFLEAFAYEQHGRTITELQDRSHVRDGATPRILERLFRTRWHVAPDPLELEELAGSLAEVVLRDFGGITLSPVHRRRALSPARLRAVLALVEAELHKPLRVADLASVARLSPSHFAHAFRSETGWTPYGFVMARRVERAKQLMARSRLTAAEIAAASGFSSVPHLSHAFQRHSGLTIRDWRRVGGTV